MVPCYAVRCVLCALRTALCALAKPADTAVAPRSILSRRSFRTSAWFAVAGTRVPRSPPGGSTSSGSPYLQRVRAPQLRTSTKAPIALYRVLSSSHYSTPCTGPAECWRTQGSIKDSACSTRRHCNSPHALPRVSTITSNSISAGTIRVRVGYVSEPPRGPVHPLAADELAYTGPLQD